MLNRQAGLLLLRSSHSSTCKCVALSKQTSMMASPTSCRGNRKNQMIRKGGGNGRGSTDQDRDFWESLTKEVVFELKSEIGESKRRV